MACRWPRKMRKARINIEGPRDRHFARRPGSRRRGRSPDRAALGLAGKLGGNGLFRQHPSRPSSAGDQLAIPAEPASWPAFQESSRRRVCAPSIRIGPARFRRRRIATHRHAAGSCLRTGHTFVRCRRIAAVQDEVCAMMSLASFVGVPWISPVSGLSPALSLALRLCACITAAAKPSQPGPKRRRVAEDLYRISCPRGSREHVDCFGAHLAPFASRPFAFGTVVHGGRRRHGWQAARPCRSPDDRPGVLGPCQKALKSGPVPGQGRAPRRRVMDPRYRLTRRRAKPRLTDEDRMTSCCRTAACHGGVVAASQDSRTPSVHHSNLGPSHPSYSGIGTSNQWSCRRTTPVTADADARGLHGRDPCPGAALAARITAPAWATGPGLPVRCGPATRSPPSAWRPFLLFDQPLGRVLPARAAISPIMMIDRFPGRRR